ncbi:MAG: hypothetical protein C0631_03775 [Sedimenticola sp.]|nr:MAG: hypothetical protein C0631_03775 [Sedimenticola sp.]
MSKDTKDEVNNSRREFLKKSAFAAYTTPALLSIAVSTDAAEYTNKEIKRYNDCVRRKTNKKGWTQERAEAFCSNKWLK